MKENFYDIESLDNVFTLCNFKPYENLIDVYYLCENLSIPKKQNMKKYLLKIIHEKNKNFNGDIDLFDLTLESDCRHLARTFGLSDARIINNDRDISSYPSEFRLVCDTDEEYDDNKHPYLFGYNSHNYDTTMLAAFFYESFTYDKKTKSCIFTPTTAKLMREFNDRLFTEKFKKSMPQALTYFYDKIKKQWSDQNYDDPRWKIRQNMLLSGRHIDVAKLNEKQSKVALKRLLGMLGYQILESDKLDVGVNHIDTFDQFCDIIAYNVSDVVNLKELFHHKFYQGKFSLKKELLKTYPELVYKQDGNTYKPKCDKYNVRRDRLNINSSSTQFATKTLCPYGHLTDIETVSFKYPSDSKIKELAAKGKMMKQVNVLEETKKFFFEKFPQEELREKFMKIYNYYKNIEGKNFNDSIFYKRDFGDENGILPDHLQPYVLSEIQKDDNCIPYFNADGTHSSCYITFSTGGIHGAEYNLKKYTNDLQKWKYQNELIKKVKEIYPDPVELRNANTVKIGGEEHSYKKFLKSNATIKAMKATPIAIRKHTFYKNLENKKPILFNKLSDGSTKLNPAYAFTSAALTNHEDFVSYYPNILRMMRAFWNDRLGIDRYGEIFDNKVLYGKLKKDVSIPKDKREMYVILQDGTKLLLNSITGAADTKAQFRSNVQMNNKIISMRIIGQLFTYRIGQAQTFEGAKIPSTNTDGLYSIMEKNINNKILKRESNNIGVEIEPEQLYLISKDTNSRLEMDHKTGKIESASGGSLSCYADTDPTKSLNHPAILDWALSEYLIIAATGYKNLSLEKPFDKKIGKNILKSAVNKFDKKHLLRMYQNVLASSTGSMSYVFGRRKDKEKPIIMQHYNRVFIVKDDNDDTVNIVSANAKVITTAMANKRARKNERAIQHDPLAMSVLNANNVKASEIPRNKEAVINKVTNVEPTWNMLIQNNSINSMTDEELDNIYNRLDIDKYLILLENTYEKNWRNIIPDHIMTDSEIFEKTNK